LEHVVREHLRADEGVEGGARGEERSWLTRLFGKGLVFVGMVARGGTRDLALGEADWGFFGVIFGDSVDSLRFGGLSTGLAASRRLGGGRMGMSANEWDNFRGGVSNSVVRSIGGAERTSFGMLLMVEGFGPESTLWITVRIWCAHISQHRRSLICVIVESGTGWWHFAQETGTWGEKLPDKVRCSLESWGMSGKCVEVGVGLDGIGVRVLG
jgi:hypothetical protein